MKPEATPLVIAHRGASWDEPENTLPAFRRAIDMGADYIELDVQAARDGELVVFHDLELSRTTNGSGRLRDHSFDELRALDAGAGEPIPTLDDVLELAAGRVGVMVELKSPRLFRQHRLTERTLAALVEHGLDADAVAILSFEPAALLEVRRSWPGLRTIQNVARVSIRRAAEYAWGVGIEDRAARPRRLAAAQRHGLATAVYAVNDPARMSELAALGATGLFTDRPDVARATLGRRV